ncbi:hypothetical protein HBB16_16935 [Pseudonocardia sp. MCCB 268]|nr:hypothetical protein [Pseudonocardia cytotoxica]
MFGVDSGTPDPEPGRVGDRRRLDQTGAVGGGRQTGRPHGLPARHSRSTTGWSTGPELPVPGRRGRTVGGIRGVAFTW